MKNTLSIRLFFLLLCAFCLPLSAQRITRQYNNVSMADALKELNTLQNKYAVNFIYDDLEDFRVSTTVHSLSVPDAVSRIVGFYPIAVTQKGNVILVECVNKAQQKYIGRIVDKSGLPVEFANVALFTPDTHTLQVVCRTPTDCLLSPRTHHLWCWKYRSWATKR